MLTKKQREQKKQRQQRNKGNKVPKSSHLFTYIFANANTFLISNGSFEKHVHVCTNATTMHVKEISLLHFCRGKMVCSILNDSVLSPLFRYSQALTITAPHPYIIYLISNVQQHPQVNIWSKFKVYKTGIKWHNSIPLHLSTIKYKTIIRHDLNNLIIHSKMKFPAESLPDTFKSRALKFKHN